MSNRTCFLSKIKKAKYSEKSGLFVELWKRLAHYNFHNVYWKFLPGRFRMQTSANNGIAVKNILIKKLPSCFLKNLKARATSIQNEFKDFMKRNPAFKTFDEFHCFNFVNL